MDNIETVPPWYRQFWPWFLILLPASVVVACMVTIWLALEKPHHMVVDDYYKEGKTINLSLAKSERARQLGLTASLVLSSDKTGDKERLLVELDGLEPVVVSTLQLKLIHPVNSGQDLTIDLESLGDGRYQTIRQLPRQRWYVQLSSNQGEASWRLQGEANFAVYRQALLAP